MNTRIQVGASRTELVKEALLKIIREQNPRMKKLPSEGELSRTLGVSISTIREALRLLDKEGFITKKHGSGNFIHWSALDCPMRIDLIFDFRQLMEESGYPASSISEEMKDKTSHSKDVKSLKIPEGSGILEYTRTYHSHEGIGIVSVSSLPKKNLTAHPDKRHKYKLLSDFIWDSCGKQVAHSLCTFIPVISNEYLNDVFGFKHEEAIIQWNEIFYDNEDSPILSTRVYFNPCLIKMSLLRKKHN